MPRRPDLTASSCTGLTVTCSINSCVTARTAAPMNTAARLRTAPAFAGPTAGPSDRVRATPILRRIFAGALIVNGGYDVRSGNAAVARGDADLVAFGVPFLANPDLPIRYRKNASLNTPDTATFYAGETKGYTDYPALPLVA